jgi:trypsin-like peptidase
MPKDTLTFSTGSLCVIGLLALSLFSYPTAFAQQIGGAAIGSQVRVVRALVGAKAEARNGAFVMTEPRSTFYAPEDREVIVYFEWEGPKGVHHCEGSVHGPGGESASMSSFDYIATQPRFGGFWRVPLSQGTPPGAWTFETKVDGKAAGQVSFQVAVAVKPSGIGIIVPVQSLPTPSDIYAHAVAATVDVEKLDAEGHAIHHSSGFLLKDGAVVTSFRGIDGAASLRLRLSNGEQLPSPLIATWDRRQDWALLTTSSKTSTPLKLAEPKTWKIGDSCYWLDVKTDGSRILSDGQIVGLKSPSLWGDRIDFSGVYDPAGMGGALLNDQGEVIGILGGALPESFLNSYAPQLQSDSELAFYTVGGIAVAANLLPQSLPSSPTSLQDLWAKGQMTPPLVNSNYVLYGMLTRAIKTTDTKPPAADRDNQYRFQRGDANAGAFVHFANTTAFKSTVILKVYDMDNHVVVSSGSEKVSVNRGEHAERLWQLPIAKLPAGIYRVDVEVADGVAWRQYFKLLD